ncbi:MAG: N-acetylmuramoyl-L-alanine amidase [Elusimicrobia bacterium]|nr:N-acetylmuramoyl-L-alanine amidase [Elusimicrobiota bacterium]
MLPLLALLLASGSVFAADPGMQVYFKGSAAAIRIVVPQASRPGHVIFDSGVSAPLPAAFESILFHGRTQAGVRFEAQAGNGSVWGPWTAPEIETFSNGRFWGKFRLAGTAGTSVRLRLLNRGVPPKRVIDIFEVEAFRKVPEPIVITPSRVELSTRPGKPDVESRADWNAAPPKYDYTQIDPGRITIHHTAGAQPETLDDARSEMRLIQRYHQAGRGWNDIGYHFLIDGAGRIFQGRPENVLGAHVLNHNMGNIGISFMGNYQLPINDQPSPEQLKAVVALVRWLSEAYSIPLANLAGHRDLGKTDCPGDNLYSRLPEIREAADQPVPPPGPTAPGLPEVPGRLRRFGSSEPFLGR